MTFVSFAPNNEDVLLWRALKLVRVGLYIDDGAADPDRNSITRAFYERGWNGVNIAADTVQARRIAAARLRDVTLDRAALLAPGQNFEALVPEMAAATVHYMRIDDATDEPIFDRFDFARCRPWILIVRLAAPDGVAKDGVAKDGGAKDGRNREQHLRSHGYGFVWFDGINRFYLAEEKAAELAGAFGTPPNSLDDFVPAESRPIVDRLLAAEARSEALAEHVRLVEAGARETTRVLMETRSRNDHHFNMIQANERAYSQERAQFARQAAEQERRALDAEHWERVLRHSTSWRLTGPLRYLLGRLTGRHGTETPRSTLPEPEIAALPAAVAVPQGETLPVPGGVEPPGFLARPARRTIHQFHPGSARGDAITSAMLLIRKILRELGYASEIYCDRLAPAFESDLRQMELLPAHADYVLLVHFSLGFEKLEQILSLPAPKVLMYHNITPPEFLSEMPGLQALAALGYQQLDLWRPHVAVALAVSEYNALHLRARGFDVVRSCPLLFDLDDLRHRAGSRPLSAESRPAGSRPAGSRPFTLLFVGRLVESKGQHDLLEAFALFRRMFQGPCRLHLVGHGQDTANTFASRLRARVAALDLGADVAFLGVLDDRALQRAYEEADLYVSLSRHEGFGVTLIEAMVHGMPVVALPCGAVPDTLGGAGVLLDDRAPAAVAARILALANDAALRDAVVRRQNASLHRFRLDRQVPVLLQALALAGAALPEDPATRQVLQAGLTYQIEGHANGSYSLAAVTRALALSLEATRPGRVRLLAVEGVPTDDLSGIAAAERPAIAALAARDRSSSGPIVSISHHYPVHVPADRGDVCLALFFWEESLIPMATVRVLNDRFDGVLATSRFVAKVLVDSGVRIPVHHVGQAPPLEDFRRIGQERQARTGARTGPYTFLHVSSCLPRKGVDVLLAAYVRAFRRSDPVRLVIKGFPNPHNEVPGQLDAIRAGDPQAPEIVLVNGDLDRQAMLDLFREADAMVLPTRGEGFNLPAAEAIAAGLKLIVTGFGGHMDFCTPDNARLLTYRMAPSGSHLASGNSLWAEPSVDDLVDALREAPTARGQGHVARMPAGFDEAAMVERIEAAALDCLQARPPGRVRIGWVTTWDVRCGVAEYTRHLLTAWPRQAASLLTPGPRQAASLLTPGRPDSASEHLVLADARAGSGAAAYRLANIPVRVGWEVGSGFDPHQLIDVIARQDPDVLVLQHQPGLMSWPFLARVLLSQAASDRAVAITLHSTVTLADLSPADRQDALDGLKRAGRVIVHTLADLERLKGYEVAANVVLMPHGVPPRAAGSPVPPVRPFTTSTGRHDGPVIGCYGFFLPGKGIPELIAAVSLLRAGGWGVRLRLVNAAYGIAASDEEMSRCRQAVATAGLDEAVEWHTDFLPEAQSRDLLAGCDLIVLPYQSSKESSSAALRSALTTCVPVAVTPLDVFADAQDAVWRFEGTTPDRIASGIHRLLEQAELRERMQRQAGLWMQRHGWHDIAERMDGLLRGLLQERRISLQRP